MKASIKFREERAPLLRAKVPIKLGGASLSSGVVLGDSRDLAVHVGTAFHAGPCMKLAFKPNESNILSLIVKTGLGAWGSPHGTSLTLTAEFQFAPKSGQSVFALRLKPRVGDFSIQKDFKPLHTYLTVRKDDTVQQTELKTPDHVFLSENGDNTSANVITPHKLDNSGFSTPLSNGDAKGANKRAGFHEKERVRSPLVESSNVVIGSNFSLKIEGFDKERKGRGDRKQKGEGIDVDSDTGLGGGGTVAHALDEALQEHNKEPQRSGVSMAGIQKSLQGSRIIAHSSIPVGSQALLNLRWGVKPPTELFQGWDGNLPSFSFSKLPSLLLDKISFERVVPLVTKSKDISSTSNAGSLDQGLSLVGFVEENQELAKVAAMCYSMKRQLQLMYVENKVLRRAMEDMRSQVQTRGSSEAWSSAGDLPLEEQVIPKSQLRSPLLESPRRRNTGDEVRKDGDARKGQKDGPRKDSGVDLKVSNTERSLSGTSDVSRELERAILSAKNGATENRKN